MIRFGEYRSTLSFIWQCRTLRHAVYLSLTILLITSVVALSWWLPAKVQVNKLENAIATKRKMMVSNVRLVQLRDAQRRAELEIPALEKKLNSTMSQADLVRTIAKLAKDHGIHIMSQSFDEGKDDRDNAALYIDLNLSGSYAAIRGMAADLTALPIWVEIIDASFLNNSEKTVSISAQLRLLTYRAGRTSL